MGKCKLQPLCLTTGLSQGLVDDVDVVYDSFIDASSCHFEYLDGFSCSSQGFI